MADKHGIGTYVNEAHELATDALDVFSIPPVESALLYGKQLTIYPSTVLTSDGPVEFLLPGDSTELTALNMTRLEGELEVTKADGSALGDADKASIVNLFPQSLWKQIECSIKDTQIIDLSTPTYHYKSFIETHLTYPDELKNSTLKDCEFYIKDDVGKENVFLVGAAEAKNDGFIKRKALIKGKLYFSIIPHIDFFQCPRFLIPGCDIKLKFIRADDNFSLLADGVEAKIKINKLVLKVRRVTADSTIINAMESSLSNTPAVYPICKSIIKTHLLNAGTSNTQISQIVRGKLPRSFILCFVNAKAYDGNKNKNPFVFENFGLNYLNVMINGEPLNPTIFQPDFDSENYTREYRWLLDNTGFHQNATNGITKSEFKSNSCFIPFDLSPDLCNSVYLHGIENGTIDIGLGFKTALAENIYCMMYSSYDELITIDKNRNVLIS